MSTNLTLVDTRETPIRNDQLWSADEENWTKIITAEGGAFDLRLRETWKYRELIILLFYRNIVQFYQQTILGPIWWIIQPLTMCFIYTLIFVVVAKVATDGIPAVLFFLSGLTLWQFFNNVLTKSANVFRTGISICGKIYVPKMAIHLSNVMQSFMQFGVQFAFLSICFFVYRSFYPDLTLRPTMLLLFPILLHLVLLGTGVGFILASLSYCYRDLTLMISPSMRMFRYFSAVLIPMSAFPEKYQILLAWNPLVPIMELYRWALFGSGTFGVFGIATSLTTTTACLLLGAYCFSRANRKFMDTI